MKVPLPTAKKEQKFISIEGGFSSHIDINSINLNLEKGWRVKSVTSQLISASTNFPIYGGFLILIQKNN